jgi:hypothetical protein
MGAWPAWGASAWSVIRKPWFGWVAFAALFCLYVRHPRTVTVTKTVTTTETKVITEWKTRLVAGAGSKTEVLPDGRLSITGPVSISSEGVSASDTRTATATTTTVKPALADWSVGAGVLIPRPYLLPVPEYQAMVGRRIFGGLWVDATVLVRSGGPSVGLAARIEW